MSVSRAPTPSSAPPVARLTHVEDAEVVEVREVLCELRPDRGGPLGWAPDGSAPLPAGSSWTPALRGGSSEVPAILPGAFAPTVAASRAPDLDHGYPALGDEARATLRWMQRAGTLKQGLRALYQACALSSTISTEEQRDAWKAMAEGVRVAALVVAALWWVSGRLGHLAEAAQAYQQYLDSVDTTPALRAEVEEALAALFAELPIGGTVRLGDLYQAIEGVPGVESSLISAPASDTALGATEVAVPTFTLTPAYV